MSLYTIETLVNYIKKKQGDESEVRFAEKVGISRTALRAIKAGKYNPTVKVCAKIGLEIVYRIADKQKG